MQMNIIYVRTRVKNMKKRDRRRVCNTLEIG